MRMTNGHLGEHSTTWALSPPPMVTLSASILWWHINQGPSRSKSMGRSAALYFCKDPSSYSGFVIRSFPTLQNNVYCIIMYIYRVVTTYCTGCLWDAASSHLVKYKILLNTPAFNTKQGLLAAVGKV